MSNLKIQKIWQDSYEDYCQSGHFQSDEQRKASRAILACKSSRLGINVSECRECGYMEFHNNSCRNRNCPNCQAVLKEIWVDKRRAEVIDSPYFHVVFTLPHELSPLIYCNQKLLYGLLHKCCAETLLELSADKKYLGAQPGIIQVLHTWNQELDYHVHMHCIVSGGGLTPDRRIRKYSAKFFIPVRVLRDKFQGKYLCISRRNLFFLPPAGNCRRTASGRSSKTAFMEKTGALTSRRPSTALVTPSNIWGAIPTRSQSPTAGSFPSRKQRLSSLHGAGNPVIRNGRSLSATKSLSGVSCCMCSPPVSRRSAIMDSSITG